MLVRGKSSPTIAAGMACPVELHQHRMGLSIRPISQRRGVQQGTLDVCPTIWQTNNDLIGSSLLA